MKKRKSLIRVFKDQGMELLYGTLVWKSGRELSYLSVWNSLVCGLGNSSTSLSMFVLGNYPNFLCLGL